jgi:hypothetical protein
LDANLDVPVSRNAIAMRRMNKINNLRLSFLPGPQYRHYWEKADRLKPVTQEVRVAFSLAEDC